MNLIFDGKTKGGLGLLSIYCQHHYFYCGGLHLVHGLYPFFASSKVT